LGNKDIHYTLAGSDGCDSIVNVYITSLQWPSPPIVDLDCENAVYQASIDLPSPWQVSWSNGDTTTTTTLTQSPSSATINYQNRCVRTFDLMTVALPDLNTLPSLTDQTIQPGVGLSLNVNLDPSVWKIQWLPTSIASCDTCFTTLLNPERDVTMTLQLTHVSGCIYTRSFTIVVENPPPVIVIPNVLTPTIPGENAIWDFILPAGYTLIDVSIFDRWGSRVFHGLPPWDGSFNQCPVLPGVYVYTIHYTDPAGNAIFLKGDVTVVR
jgi:gliding motility-associated-like protein